MSKEKEKKNFKKLKTFNSIKNCFAISGINSPQSTRKDLLKITNILSILLICVDLILSSVYVYYEANSFEDYVDSVYVVPSLMLSFFIFTTLLWQMPMLYTFINHLESSIAKRFFHRVSKKIYVEIDGKLQNWNKILNIALVKIMPIGVIVPKSITCLIVYLMSDLGTNAFELPVPGTWFPFNWKNPIGYIIVCSFQYISTLNRLFATCCTLIFEMGSIFMLICMTKDIKRDLKSINKKVIDKKTRSKIIKRFKELIQFHYDAKQLTGAFSKPWKPIFIAIFSWCTISTAAALLLIKIELNLNYPMDAVFYRFFQLCISLATVFSVCEFGHRISNAFDESSAAFDRLKWYLLPLEMWQMIPTVLVAAQNPIKFHVFGSISCSREDFKQVANTAFTYFMMLKHIGLRN